MYILSIDIPGVKAEDISIHVKDGAVKFSAERKSRSGEVMAQYRQTFALDEHSIELGQVTAHFSEGVLSLSIPKKLNEGPITVFVQDAEAPDESEKEMRLHLDIPGVKVNDTKISFERSTLTVKAQRSQGRFKSTTHRQYRVDPKTTDMHAAQAFLTDGVLTIVAPHKDAPTAEDYNVPVLVGALPKSVLETNSVDGLSEVSLASETREETETQEKTTEDAIEAEEEIIVETANDDDEEDDEEGKSEADWENVHASSS